MNFRLVCHPEIQRWGDVEMDRVRYFLQVRVNDEAPWETVPVVDWRLLPTDERDAIERALGTRCRTCNADGWRTPCAYPGVNKPGCMRPTRG